MTRRACIVALAVLLILGSTTQVRANQIYSTSRDGPGLFQEVFAVTDTVCVAGDVDFTCPVGPIMLPGADVYVVVTGTNPLAAVPIHFETLGGAGGFWDEVVMLPPLVPGTYDILLDEHCDGVITGDDVLEVAAFTVGGALTCDAPPGLPINPEYQAVRVAVAHVGETARRVAHRRRL